MFQDFQGTQWGSKFGKDGSTNMSCGVHILDMNCLCGDLYSDVLELGGPPAVDGRHPATSSMGRVL